MTAWVVTFRDGRTELCATLAEATPVLLAAVERGESVEMDSASFAHLAFVADNAVTFADSLAREGDAARARHEYRRAAAACLTVADMLEASAQSAEMAAQSAALRKRALHALAQAGTAGRH